MNNFEENHCRLCREVLCCVECRRNHESHVHKINPDCEICLYGRVDLKNLPYCLLEHIERHHWPLHCVKCKRRFGSIDHLTTHSKCPAGLVLNGGVPKKTLGIMTMSADTHYNSPPLSDFHKNLPNPNIAASTPTPTPKIELDTEPPKVTPGNDVEKRQQISTVGSTPNDSTKNEPSLKRRVTFCETPILECSGRKQLLNIHKSASIAEEDVQGTLQSKLRNPTVHQNMIDSNKTLPDRPLEISVSPLFMNKDTGDCDSPQTGGDSHKSIIAGSNQCFLGKQKNIEAVTSTPRVGKHDDQGKSSTEAETPTEIENKSNTNHVKTPDNITSNIANVEVDASSNARHKDQIEKFPTSYQTPVMSTSMKQKQLLLTTSKQFTGETTSQFYSMSSLKQTPPVNTALPQKVGKENENLNNKLGDVNLMKTNIQIEETLWMSAVNNLNCSEDDDTEKMEASIKDVKHGEILSVCLKKVTQVPQNAVAISTETNCDLSSKINIPKSNLWTSMTQAFNSVVTGLSLLNKSEFVGEQGSSSTKRSWVDEDTEDEFEPHKKRLKITDVKCRRTIRPICPLSHSVFKIMVDKATQTD